MVKACIYAIRSFKVSKDFMLKIFPVLGLTVLIGSTAALQAADHLDAPALREFGQSQRDINDLYAFQSPVDSQQQRFDPDDQPVCHR